MRISDWSSDVCSSDLVDHRIALDQRVAVGGGDGSAVRLRQIRDGGFDLRRAAIGGRGIDENADAPRGLGDGDGIRDRGRHGREENAFAGSAFGLEIVKASVWDEGVQYLLIPLVAEHFKQNSKAT